VKPKAARPARADTDARSLRRTRLAGERGTIVKAARHSVALVYPSPYPVAMSSLGFQTIYREINEAPDCAAERAFLPDDVEPFRRSRTPLFTYESERPAADFPVMAFSVSYELEVAGVVTALELAGLPPLAEERDGRHPFVLMGGPLTFSNPLPLAPFADAILMGESDETIHQALGVLSDCHDRVDACRALAAAVPSAFVPTLHGNALPPLARCSDERLPARGAILAHDTELRDMFLIEAVRGCSRGCAYCVMRRSTGGGMRVIPKERVLGLIPPEARRIGLVGAGVSDHPAIVEIVETLAAQGREVGLSSLRPDRLNAPFASALRRAGYRTLTTAADGASQRLRELVERRIQEQSLISAAELARDHGFKRLKLYLLVGLPGETDDDIDELIRLARALARIHPLALAVAPFVSKRNTPLDGQPFAGVHVVEQRLSRLRAALSRTVDLRATSGRWAWVEYRLAQGGPAEGRAALAAVHAGGRFSDWKRALEAMS
jgi:radical SAM superfamily enzyme YgiQ (UPF0313 family)